MKWIEDNLIAVLAFIIMASCGKAHARLGETLEQCVARYGDPVDKNSKDGTLFFKSGDIGMWFTYLNGKVVAEEYIPRFKPDRLLKPEEINRILDINSAGAKWIYSQEETLRQPSDSVTILKEIYLRNDSGATAIHTILSNQKEFLEIVSKEYSDHLENKSLPGL